MISGSQVRLHRCERVMFGLLPAMSQMRKYIEVRNTRELVDSLCRDGLDMQYLVKAIQLHHKYAKSIFKYDSKTHIIAQKPHSLSLHLFKL